MSPTLNESSALERKLMSLKYTNSISLWDCHIFNLYLEALQNVFFQIWAYDVYKLVLALMAHVHVVSVRTQVNALSKTTTT